MTARLLNLLLILSMLAACNFTPATTLPTVATPGPATPTRPGATASPPPLRPDLTPSAGPSPARGTRAPTASSEPPAASPRPLYALAAVYDHPGHTLDVTERIAYPNQAQHALNELVFEVGPDARPGQLTLTRVSVAGELVAVERSGPRWRVALAEPLAPGAVVAIEIVYALALAPLPAGAADAAGGLGWTARQINLGHWYPVVAAYRDATWLVHAPFGPGEYQAHAAADYQVELTIRGLSGATVAASAPGSMLPTGQGEHWSYRATALRSFALSINTHVLVSEAQAGPVLVRAYTFPEHKVAGAAALAAVAQAVEIYSRLYGQYPYPELALVEGDFRDGLEFAGLFFLGRDYYAGYDGTPRNYLIAIGVHEAAHQWWYAMVGNDQALEPWLDEGLATYSELVFYQNAYPELEAWWWDFRVRRYNPQGAVNQTIYDLPAFRPYVDAVYLRSALCLHELRLQLGDAAFFAFLQRYVAANTGAIATGVEFWGALGAEVDTSALREKYFR